LKNLTAEKIVIWFWALVWCGEVEADARRKEEESSKLKMQNSKLKTIQKREWPAKRVLMCSRHDKEIARILRRLGVRNA